MSKQGWREFLAADGVDDWVVLHDGPAAVFRVPTMADAARLAAAVATVSGVAGSGALLTVADDCLKVRLTRGVYRLEDDHVALARAVSAVAREHGAVADRGRVHGVQVAISAKPDTVDVGFWRAVLGYDAVAAGGRIVDDSEAPESWVLSDRAGNRVCVTAWPDGAVPAS